MKISIEALKKEARKDQDTPEVDAEAINQKIVSIMSKLEGYGVKSLNPKIYNPMVRYLAETSINCRTNGLLYFGAVGTGKTFALKVISAFRKLNFYTADDLVLMHVKDPGAFWEKIEDRKDIIIDDLGTEPVRSDFGSRFELMEHALQKRYRMWESHGHKTLISTNLSGEAIKERYTERLYSRLKHMCEPVNATGKDLRNEKLWESRNMKSELDKAYEITKKTSHGMYKGKKK